MAKERKNKFLFYFCGKPVYEGDETHQHLQRVKEEFGGDMIAAAKHDAAEVERLMDELFKKKNKTK